MEAHAMRKFVEHTLEKSAIPYVKKIFHKNAIEVSHCVGPCCNKKAKKSPILALCLICGVFVCTSFVHRALMWKSILRGNEISSFDHLEKYRMNSTLLI